MSVKTKSFFYFRRCACRWHSLTSMTLIEAVLLVCAGKITETKIQEWGTQNQGPKTERRPSYYFMLLAKYYACEKFTNPSIDVKYTLVTCGVGWIQQWVAIVLMSLFCIINYRSCRTRKWSHASLSVLWGTVFQRDGERSVQYKGVHFVKYGLFFRFSNGTLWSKSQDRKWIWVRW